MIIGHGVSRERRRENEKKICRSTAAWPPNDLATPSKFRSDLLPEEDRKGGRERVVGETREGENLLRRAVLLAVVR